ncbi:MAG TPA: nicotinate-nucleotide adenylyltransferase [Chlamydiales bacterium]|nr:nicotinate-nucleotide adenylyltransferase [Chlamydiales bacterium]
MKVGFFGGTFDPIHLGHLNLAIQIMEMEGLDEVIFSPAWQSPFKESLSETSASDRLEMVNLAIQEIPKFRSTDYEIRKESPSYTIEALHHFQRGSEAKFFIILAEEVALHFLQWKEAKELLQIAPPLIGIRSSSMNINSLPEALQGGVRKTNIFEISSTEIRDRLKKGLYCGHLLPEKVLSYIKKRRLYQK